MKFELVDMKYEVVEWLGIDLAIPWLWVQALGNLGVGRIFKF